MGFTFSHPALILPGKNLPARYCSFTGLIAGSMVPDFEYFITLNKESVLSHTWYGVFLFDLPLAILLAFAYHLLIRPVLVPNLPGYFKKRLSRFMCFNWPRYYNRNKFVVITSILAGIASHLLWDSFTSINGYFVSLFPFLNIQLNWDGTTFFVYKIIKHLSSGIGAGILIWEFNRMKISPSGETQANKYFWLFFSLLFIFLLALFVFFEPAHQSYNRFVKTTITSFLLALMVVSLIYQKRTKQIYANN
jgi:hypothetical protein